MIFCNCGCGAVVSPDKYGRPRSYIHGHNSRGRKMSDETKQKLSRERMGSLNPVFGKPKTQKQLDAYSKIWKGKTIPDHIKKKMSIAKLGKVCTDQHRQNMSKAFKGRKLSEETKRKMSLGRRGEKCNFWKGGKTEKAQLVRSSAEYKEWRKTIFSRDNYKCVLCGNGGYIQADHIKPFSLYPELVFDLSNGRTLCKPCHKQTATYGRNSWKNKQNCLHVDCV